MKFILKTTIKILIFSVLFIIPIGLFITFFSLSGRNIPIWNIGIRNILLFSQNYSLLIIFISYLISTLLIISLTDKQKVRSIFLLHIPALIAGGILVGGIYLTRYRHYPLSLGEKNVQLDHRAFLRENVFNDVSGKLILIKKSENNYYTLYIYDRTKNDLVIANNVGIGTGKKNFISISQNNRRLNFTYERNKKSESLIIPYKDFTVKNDLINNRLINRYTVQIRKLTISLSNYFMNLDQTDKYIFLGTLFISVLMISIPLTYALNDGGWGFSGIIGVILLLVLLPFFYGAVFKILQRFRFGMSFLGRYSYLSSPLILCFCGFFIDLLVKIRRREKKI